jgi:Tfp pilus assembly protein PilF
VGAAAVMPRWRTAVMVTAVAGSALHFLPASADRIVNPEIVPASMEEEGQGPKGPFWPSAAVTNTGTTIPSDFFMDSKLCGECHKDIYEQWNSSAHHFASFNNQFYRKSIEFMQEVQGTTQPSKWCAGCHDHAVFFNGRWEKPIKDQVNTPEAQNGLGCVSCHSIAHVDSSMGNGGFTMFYPPLHNLASSRNKYIRSLDRFLTYLEPEPHRRTFLKPFMRQDSAEFCASCHKVHLDKPVNQYRWIRGFNDYDNWQASGVSGQGARSFYYPPKSQTCTDCHMKTVPSDDPGNRNGLVHNHRFAAANSALAHVNNDAKQAEEVRAFLQSGFITVDLFAASRMNGENEGREAKAAGERGPQLATTFATGEEADSHTNVTIRKVEDVAAPLDKTSTVFQPGETVRVDAVVRTRKIGHFFPGGTVDAFDVWLELKATDAAGKPVFWSGRVENDGPVDPSAHFYRSFLLDADGAHIDKRNAWQARSTLYVRLIPPGAADTVHYKLTIPRDAKGPISLHAKLNHRKFSHFYNEFAFDKFPEKKKPLPIITLAEAKASLQVGAGPSAMVQKLEKTDRERWNDWGIGMLLQGDIKGAEYAFQKVTEADPGYPDGWVNWARALIQEGETAAAKPHLARALSMVPDLARGLFFRAMVEKADGEYAAAIASLNAAAAQYPRDRVVQNQLARIHFLNRNYKGAVEHARKVLGVDPEDVQAHYTLMLAYRGLGDNAAAAREQALFARFKADESAQAITQTRRLASPEDNNERQMIHDHGSGIGGETRTGAKITRALPGVRAGRVRTGD